MEVTGAIETIGATGMMGLTDMTGVTKRTKAIRAQCGSARRREAEITHLLRVEGTEAASYSGWSTVWAWISDEGVEGG